jgi:hypothetical protein
MLEKIIIFINNKKMRKEGKTRGWRVNEEKSGRKWV